MDTLHLKAHYQLARVMISTETHGPNIWAIFFQDGCDGENSVSMKSFQLPQCDIRRGIRK